MKIVKRDGRTVEYDRKKIVDAILKANRDVNKENEISFDEIEEITTYIENLGKKRMLVEDIQDIIEVKLMEKGKYDLAKAYIIYRYKRSIIRKSNTTDASILALLKNKSFNGEYLVANRQRSVMAGEVSKDLAYRLLLPSNVVAASKKNRIRFMNVEYFTEPVIESCKINLADMLSTGTTINNISIRSPKSFQSACNILVEIIASIASCQTGNILIDLKDLFPYYNQSYEKIYTNYKMIMKNSLTNEEISALARNQTFLEIKSGIQTIIYQINTIMISSGQVPKVQILVDLEDITSEAEERIVYEFIRQKSEGILNDGVSLVTLYPEVIACFPKKKDILEKYDYIIEKLFTSKASFTVMGREAFLHFVENYKRFNQGSIALNLLNLSLISADVENFYELLKESLLVCYEGFLCRNHNLYGVLAEKSPIHFRYGGLARLEKFSKIDEYLRKEHSYMTLIVFGFEAAVNVLGAKDVVKKTICDIIENTVSEWNKKSTFEVLVSNYYDEDLVRDFVQEDGEMLKKYKNINYLDSLEFMKCNYFNGDFKYYITSEALNINDLEYFDKDLIFRKKESIDNDL